MSGGAGDPFGREPKALTLKRFVEQCNIFSLITVSRDLVTVCHERPQQIGIARRERCGRREGRTNGMTVKNRSGGR